MRAAVLFGSDDEQIEFKYLDGKGGTVKLDLALDPLEGTTICAQGGYNSISVIAIAEDCGQPLTLADLTTPDRSGRSPLDLGANASC